LNRKANVESLRRIEEKRSIAESFWKHVEQRNHLRFRQKVGRWDTLVSFLKIYAYMIGKVCHYRQNLWLSLKVLIRPKDMQIFLDDIAII